MNNKKTIAVIGGGNMGGALIGGLAGEYAVTVCEQDSRKAAFLRRRYGVKSESVTLAMNSCEVIILAVKPQDLASVLAEMKTLVRPRQLVISVAAGITTRYIENVLGEACRVIRVMPNLPVVIGQGFTGITPGKSAGKADVSLARRLFGTVGKTVVIDEGAIDVVTAVSGSGPAYVFYFMEILQNAAVHLGLPKEMARQMILQTLKGSVGMLDQRQADATELRQRVTSKGGTTAAALSVLNQHKVEKIFYDALMSAKRRASELSQ
jgi:pyrroline-5-carboxylate reductase